MPRPGKKCPDGVKACSGIREVLAPATFCFHHQNAYETAGGTQVVMDTVGWQGVAFETTQ
jgi:carotenoid cleavage dioxygenase-like enzyme